MGIKIKYINPSPSDLSFNDIVINVKTGDLFYKGESNTLFRLKGDNTKTKTDTIIFDSNLSASKLFLGGNGVGNMVIGSSNTDVFEIGAYSLEAAGSIVPIASSDPQFDLGTLERPWRNFVVSDGSLKFVNRGLGVGFSRIGTTFKILKYGYESTKEFTTFTKENVDDLKQGRSISGSGDLRVIGRAKIDRLLTLNAGIHILNGGITGSIDGGSF